MAKYCEKCGNKINEGAKYCDGCGAQVGFNEEYPSHPKFVKRDMVMAVVLSFLTCGIYGIYWFIVLSNDTNTVSNAENATSGGVAFVLSLITCNIYGLYWAYKQGEKIDKAKTDRGIPSSNSGVIYLILCFVGLGIVAEALMQNELNSLA